MELAGHECVGFCEWDKFAVASYTSMHLLTDEQRSRLAGMDLKARQKEILKEEYRNGEWYSADVRLITADNVPRADCWCFGAPCQDFSIAGQRKGLGGDRSSLVREVFRVLGELKEEDRPEWLIYENVKGMLSSNRGFDFLAILLELLVVGKIAPILAFKIVKPTDRPQFITYAISFFICALMCPIMSLIAIFLFKKPSLATFVQTWAMNLPAAFLWQFVVCGPFVRLLYRLVFDRKVRVEA